MTMASLMLGNGTGLIDSDYRGEIFVSLWNRSEYTITIEQDQRIAQMVFMPFVRAEFNEVDELVGIFPVWCVTRNV